MTISLPRLGAGSSVAVTREYLCLDDPSVGVVYGSTANQAAKIQSALNMAAAAGGGTVLCAGKVRAASTEILWPEGGGGRGSVRLLGTGSGSEFSESPSGIYWDQDTASAAPAPGDHANTKFGLRVSTNSLAATIEKITLQGPGENVPIGSMPCKMYGLFMPTRCIVDDVTLVRWGAGLGLINDHQVFRNVNAQGNGYGIDFMDNSLGGLGDLLFDRCYFISQSRASIALSNSNAIANARFIQGHAGAAPFGIYRYTGQEAARTTALQGVVFENWSWEYCGNAMFYDEAGGGTWAKIAFDSPAEFGTGGSAKWPGKPWPMANMHIDVGDGIHWRGGPAVPQGDNPDQPLISAKDLYNCVMDDAAPLADAVLQYGHKSFVRRSGGVGAKYVSNRLGMSPMSGIGLTLGMQEASEAITRGSLVEQVGTNQVRVSRNGATSQIVGVSLIDYSAGDVCVYAASGARAGLVVRNAGGAIGGTSLLAPDPANQGCVKAWAAGDRVVGRAHDGTIGAGTTGPIMVSV